MKSERETPASGNFSRTPTVKATYVASFISCLWIALFVILGTPAAFAADPSGVSTRLEGCRPTSDITAPYSAAGAFICPDALYTTGNLGTFWDELDLVPYRLTLSAGNSAPANQTYTLAVVLDNKAGVATGFDVLSAPTLNTGLSSASCSAPSVGADSLAIPGVGGISESRYRLLTVTQAKNSTCVYDYYGRLSIGASLFPGASLHANLTNETLGTAGVGARDVSIPTREISPQSLRKDMAATQDASHAWNLTKTASAASASFGDVCAANASTSKPVSFRVVWTKIAATPGMTTVTTNIYATNPAARSITVNVTDVIYRGTTQTEALHTASSGPFAVPANTESLVLMHTVTIPTSAGAIGDYLNDVATATYTDLVTNVPILGQTMAKASTQIAVGNVLNSAANISDDESISGAGLSFSVAAPLVGSFGGGYVANAVTTGTVSWGLSGAASSGTVDFNKTIYLAARQVTTGILTDTASLMGSNGFTATAGPVNVGISSSASVQLTINKTIPGFLDAGEIIEVKFNISRLSDPTYSREETFTFNGGGATTQSRAISGLVPDDYTVTEANPLFFAAGSSSGVVIPGFQPEAGSTKVVQLGVVNGRVPNCSGTASFNNILTDGFPMVQVQKITAPVLTSADPDYNWVFTLTGPGLPAAGITATAGAGAGNVTFSIGPDPVELLQEGTYTVTETTKPGWDLNGAAPNNGTTTTVCTFRVDFPESIGQVTQCAFRNTKRGKASMVKTVSGGPLTGTQSFTFQLRQGATLTADGTTLESQSATVANSGSFTFAAFLLPGPTYQLCEVMLPGWLTTLPSAFVPNSMLAAGGPNPNVDNSILCSNFTVTPGETKVFAIDNTPPPGGRAHTIGFWKNHASCKQSGGKQAPVLDRTMALADPIGIQVGSLSLKGSLTTPDVAPDCGKARDLLDKSNFNGQKKASDPLFNMSAQLVAAELNYVAGAAPCVPITTAISAANALLTRYGFTGYGYTGRLTAADSTLANNLATKLDNYNNNLASACQ